MRKASAQIGFIQDASNENRWIGHLRSAALVRDRIYDTPAKGVVIEIVALSDDHYRLKTTAGSKGGLRYQHHSNLSAAQESAIKWAARRFYVQTN